MDDIRISMEDLNQNLVDVSTEKLAPNAFNRRYTIWRRGMVPTHFADTTNPKFQLPDNSALHFVTDFLTPNPEATINPDLSIPYITHEVWRKYYSACYNIPSANDPLYPVTDMHVFRKGLVKSGLLKFYSSHPDIKRIMTDVSVGKIRQALILYDYGILQRTALYGMFKEYRLTDLILRTILTHIVHYPHTRNHFIYVPLSDRYYSRTKFLPAFKRIHASTLKAKDDPSYDFLVNLLGFVYGIEHPQENVIPSPNDVNAITKCNADIHIGGSTSIFNRLTDEQLANINIILDHAGEAAIYNLLQLKEFASSGTFFLQFYKHVMKLKSKSLESHQIDAIDADDGTETEDNGKEVTETTSEPVTSELPEPITHEEVTEKKIEEEAKAETAKKPLLPISQSIANKAVSVKEVKTGVTKTPLSSEMAEPTQLTEHGEDPTVDTPIVDVELDYYIANLEPSAKKRAVKLLKRLDTLTLNGISLKDHITTAPKDIIHEPIVGESAKLIDPTARTSTILTFDQQYLKGNFHSDMAKTLTSFMKKGFFVAGLTEKREVSRIDDVTTYTVKFISVTDNGKQHTVKFTLPNPDKEGVFKDNGNDYRLIKQKTAMPIAKISESKVGLFSSYNKSTVERTDTRRSFKRYILRILTELTVSEKIIPHYGNIRIDETLLPLEYSYIASRFNRLDFEGYSLNFDHKYRFNDLSEEEVKTLKELEHAHGVYAGKYKKKYPIFYGHDNKLRVITDKGIDLNCSILTLLQDLFPEVKYPNIPYEYTMVTIISMDYSLIFLLGLMHGLMPTLKHVNARTRFVPSGKSLKLGKDELSIRFKNGSLVYNRYPLLQSYILSGLSWCNCKDYDIEAFSNEDTYYDILEKKGVSTNNVKGIKSFFDLFIDPITKSVLESIHEPTNVSDLLIRATEMLTTQSHYPASSERNYRIRSFERFNAIIYKEVARAIAAYDSDKTRGKVLDVHPRAVYQQIYKDPAKTLVDVINPIHEIKENTKGSYAGIGGRTSRSFVVNDRTYSEDSIGVISESTPDSGKVGMIFLSVMNPNIVDLYGRTIPHEKGDEINSATKLMSVVGNLFPGLHQDD